MIAAIDGIVSLKEPTFVVLKTDGGVSYGLSVSLFCSARLEKGQRAELFTTHIAFRKL